MTNINMPDKIIKADVFADTFKSNMITVTFVMPLKKEYASKISLLCGVLKRGNKSFGEMDKISAYLEKNYGAMLDISTAKSGELQQLNFNVGYLDDKYAIDDEPVAENIVKLLYSTIFEPITENDAFNAEFVRREKENLKDRILALINDKRIYSLEKCKQIMFQSERYGVYEQGDLDEVDKITPSSLYSFYKEILKKAMTVIIYVGSKCDTNSLLKPIVDSLEGCEREVPKTEIINTVSKVTDVIENMNVAQSKLNMGFRLGKAAEEDIVALKVFSVIFGSSPTSKLFMNVREKLSLCYYCSCMVDSLKNVMFVYSGIETSNFEKARDEILNQLELMKKGEFSDAELDDAKAYLIDSFKQAYDSQYALSSMELSGILNGKQMSIDEQICEVNNMTRERIIKIASEVKLDTVYLLKGIGGESDAD